MGETTTTTLVLRILAEVEHAKKGLKIVTDTLGNMSKAMKVANTMSSRFLNVSLSMLFFGMQMKRVFGDALKSIFDAYLRIAPVNDQFFQATQRLTAAWTFFKYSLVDALTQSPLFMTIVEAIIAIIDWFGQLSPSLKNAIVWMLMMGFALGGLLFGLGQLGTAIPGLLLLAVVIWFLALPLLIIAVIIAAIAIIWWLWTSDMAESEKVIWTIITVLAALGIVLAGIFLGVGPALVIIAAIVAIFLVWNSNLSKTDKILATIAIALAAIGLILLLTMGTAALPFLVLIGLVLLFLWLAHKFGGVMNLLRYAFEGFVLFGAWLIDNFIAGIVLGINLVIKSINLLISAYNKVASMAGWETVAPLSSLSYETGLQKKAQDWIINGQNERASKEVAETSSSEKTDLSSMEDLLKDLPDRIADSIANKATILPSTR